MCSSDRPNGAATSPNTSVVLSSVLEHGFENRKLDVGNVTFHGTESDRFFDAVAVFLRKPRRQHEVKSHVCDQLLG